MVKGISFVAGAATAALQYFQPLDRTWIGHDSWASDNLLIAAYFGAPIGAVLFLLGRSLPKWLKVLILVLVFLGFVVGIGGSIYFAQTITSVPDISDQIYFRDTVWKLLHLAGTMCLTITLFCLSFLDDP